MDAADIMTKLRRHSIPLISKEFFKINPLFDEEESVLRSHILGVFSRKCKDYISMCTYIYKNY